MLFSLSADRIHALHLFIWQQRLDFTMEVLKTLTKWENKLAYQKIKVTQTKL